MDSSGEYSMNLNPFIKVKLACPVSADVARRRLLEVTKLEMPWTFSTYPIDRYYESSRRYLGAIKGYKFRLHVRPSIPVNRMRIGPGWQWAQMVAAYRDECMAITGEIKPVPDGCTVQLVFKPKWIFFPLLIGWLAFFAFATYDMYSRSYGWRCLIPLAFVVAGLFIARTSFYSSYYLERDFLESLFTSEKWYSDSVNEPQQDPAEAS